MSAAVSDVTEMIQRGLATMLEGIKKIDHSADWIDQNSSPIGRRAHLEAVRLGLVKGSKVGRMVLVRRADLDAYIEQHRVHRVTIDEERDEQEAIDALLNTKAPKRRSRR